MVNAQVIDAVRETLVFLDNVNRVDEEIWYNADHTEARRIIAEDLRPKIKDLYDREVVSDETFISVLKGLESIFCELGNVPYTDEDKLEKNLDELRTQSWQDMAVDLAEYVSEEGQDGE